MPAEIPDGAVLVARAILNSSLWTMRAEDRVVAMTCIALANWKSKKWFDGKKEITIGRGQFVRSREQMTEACRLSPRKFRTSVKNLENIGFLTKKATKTYTLYTIPKYSHYQDLTKYSDSVVLQTTQDPTHDRPTTDQRPTYTRPTPDPKQECKEGKEGEKGEEGVQNGADAPPPSLVGTTEYQLTIAWNKSGGDKIGREKAADKIRFYMDRGATPKAIEAAFWNPIECKGKKIWEVLETLCPKKSGSSPEVNYGYPIPERS